MGGIFRYAGKYKKFTISALLVLVLWVMFSIIPYYFVYRLLDPILKHEALSLEFVPLGICVLLHMVLYSLGLILSHKGAYGTLQYLFCFLLFFALQKLVMSYTTGLLNAFIALNCYIVLRFTPTAVMAYYVIFTTTVSEFMAAMGRMYVTDKITIPIAVMFRFFPTVIEEIHAINDSMKMRGVNLGGGKLSEMLEYRIVPILMCSARIGEELSQATLTRGLGGDVRRTNIYEIGFRFVDLIFIAIGMAPIILMQIQ